MQMFTQATALMFLAGTFREIIRAPGSLVAVAEFPRPEIGLSLCSVISSSVRAIAKLFALDAAGTVRSLPGIEAVLICYSRCSSCNHFAAVRAASDTTACLFRRPLIGCATSLRDDLRDQLAADTDGVIHAEQLQQGRVQIVNRSVRISGFVTGTCSRQRYDPRK
jgi:hypothetical protein